MTAPALLRPAQQARRWDCNGTTSKPAHPFFIVGGDERSSRKAAEQTIAPLLEDKEQRGGHQGNDHFYPTGGQIDYCRGLEAGTGNCRATASRSVAAGKSGNAPKLFPFSNM
jgi:hypothetical protein